MGNTMLKYYEVKIPETIVEVATNGDAEDAKRIVQENLRDAGHTNALDGFFPPERYEVRELKGKY